MQVGISSGLIETIIGLAAADPTREVCGLLLGSGDRIEEIVPATNVAADPSCRFEVDPAVQFATLRGTRAGGGAVVGCYHSHPSGRAEPSPTDKAMIGRVGELWLICAGGRVRCWVAHTLNSFAEVELVAR
jgi:proteasome lid subunit RPN8/RPN11